MRNIIFTAPNSANAFIQEESFGQLSLTGKLRSDGDVYGPYMIQSKQTPDVCDNVGWGSDAEAQFAAATGMNAETWDNVIVVFQASQCNFSGHRRDRRAARRHGRTPRLDQRRADERRADDERRRTRARPQLRGRPRRRARVLRRRPRASRSARRARTIRTRSTNQYLDPFDVMGSGLRQENAYHKWESGWLPSASVQTVYAERDVPDRAGGVELQRGAAAGGAAPGRWAELLARLPPAVRQLVRQLLPDGPGGERRLDPLRELEHDAPPVEELADRHDAEHRHVRGLGARGWQDLHGHAARRLDHDARGFAARGPRQDHPPERRRLDPAGLPGRPHGLTRRERAPHRVDRGI